MVDPVVGSAYWHLPVEGLRTALRSPPDGLTVAQAKALQVPDSSAHRHREHRLMVLLFEQLRSPLMVILLVGAGVALWVGDWLDSAIVTCIVMASSVLSAWYESRASAAVQALRQQVAVHASVRREGRELDIPAAQVVPGDILLLSAGSLIAADGRVLSARDCFTSQGVMTGETFPVEKQPGERPERASLSERTNCVFAGTSVRSGSAEVLVVHVGAQSEFGRIAGTLAQRAPQTEFERGLRHFGALLLRVMLVVTVLVFGVNLLLARPVLDSLMFAVALCVGLSPELLPAILGITLAKGAQRMAMQGVIVRRLNAMENLGSMDVLCTDKTGTLTRGVVALDGIKDAEGADSAEVLRLAFYNSGLQTGMRNALDDAVMQAASNQGLTVEGVSKLDEIPYDFIRKRLSVVVQRAPDSAPLLVTKGALVEILQVCESQDRGGRLVVLDAEERHRIESLFSVWSEQGFRVLGLASRKLPIAQSYHREDEAGMTFQGFLLFFDPPEPQVKQTLAQLAALGVSIKIITGDNPLVASHVAHAVGLEHSVLLTGDGIAEMSDEALFHQVQRATVFAAVDPNQKERIILALRKGGHVVGFLGDGINDAPALHSADVGISVDTAADVAREAADFVLLRHDLNVLIAGIEAGRRTFANTLKYVSIVSSANFGNMLSMACASAVLPFLPLLAKQVLLNNFLSDIPSLGIAGDAIDPEWAATPHRWDLKRVQRFMWVFGLVSSAFDLCTFAVLYGIGDLQPEVFRSGWFVESLLTQVLTIFIVRTARPLHRSRPGRFLMIAAGAVMGLTLWLPYSPMAPWFGLAPLTGPLLLAMLGICGVYTVTAEAVKRLFYRFERAQRPLAIAGQGG
jgi:Mg2+-importing ATPase